MNSSFLPWSDINTPEELWTAYQKKHSEIAENAQDPKSKFLIMYMYEATGIGNRVQSLVANVLLAMLSERALIVHWKSEGIQKLAHSGEVSIHRNLKHTPTLQHVRHCYSTSKFQMAGVWSLLRVLYTSETGASPYTSTFLLSV
eukprot:GFYU01015136.1.p1 GENE.GFYU01015136.1~~GFYU01015136.1.p1  ORF type:complete len:144 (-),score=24.90 GFYU01015136.1:24-455(-)